MRIAYLANVGTRDVQRQKKFLEKPRPEGAALLTNYETVRAELSSPILSAGLRHVLQRADGVACVQLFVSDQPAPPVTKEVFWEKDTLEFGKLLQRLLPDEFGDRLGRIDCEPMRCNPADHNQTLSLFADRLRQLVPPENVDVVYVAPVGGVDASNIALTINAVRCYRQKCQFIYVMPDANVQLLNLHRELLGDYARQEAAAQLRRYDYAALGETLHQARLGQQWHLHVCEYADRRSRFDFARADAALQAALTCADGGEVTLHLSRVRQSLQPFLVHHTPPTSSSPEPAWEDWLSLQRLLLGELYFNLCLKADGREWVDFLGRLFRLHEGLLRLVFELESRHSSDENETRGYPDFKKFVQERPELAELGLEPKPTTYALGKIVVYWIRNTGRGKDYGAVKSVHDLVGELSALRNKSIIAHGYQAVSEEDIRQALKGRTVEELLDQLRGALQKLRVDLAEEKNPYTAAGQMLMPSLT